MKNREWIRCCGMGTLFFFIWSCLVPGLLRGADEDPLETARKLIKAGSYEEAARILGIYIEKIRAIAKQRDRVAEAYFLLAKMYYEVGDDQKCDGSLRTALNNNPELNPDEPNADFRARLDKIRAEVAPRTFEKLKKAEKRRLRAKNRFPWLLAAGIVVAAVIVLVLLIKKKKCTLTVTIGAGVSGTPAAGSYSYKEGTLIPYNFELAGDYTDLVVKINGTKIPASGTLLVDRDTQLEATASARALGTLIVSGKSNCLDLKNSDAVEALIHCGNYTVQVSGEAHYYSTTPFSNLFMCYEYPDSIPNYKVLPLPYPYLLGLGLYSNGANARFYAFFVEDGDRADNSGEVTLNFDSGSPQIKVSGKDNCIRVGNIPAAEMLVPRDGYDVRVSGGAFSSPAKTMNSIFVLYQNTLYGYSALILTVGETKYFVIDGKFFAFFVDWDDVGDNSGEVQLEFRR